MARTKSRSDAEYEIDALAKGLRVLEALKDASTLAIQLRRIESRTGLDYNFCMRALKTLKLAGYAAEVEGGWKLTPKAARLFKNSEIQEFSNNHLLQTNNLITYQNS